jgi:uncharacterized membrane protein
LELALLALEVGMVQPLATALGLLVCLVSLLVVAVLVLLLALLVAALLEAARLLVESLVRRQLEPLNPLRYFLSLPLALLVRLKRIVGLVGTTRRSTLLISRPLDWLRSWVGRLPGRMS